MKESSFVKGRVSWELRDEATGLLKASGAVDNIVTQIGNQYYVDRAVGAASPPAQATGMQLGTGSTAAATTGAGAAIVTLIASSLVALTSSPPTVGAGTGTARRATWVVTWAAGTATNAAIAEVALVNQATATQTAAPASATISRAVFGSTINKGASDSLTVTWTHDLGT